MKTVSFALLLALLAACAGAGHEFHDKEMDFGSVRRWR